MRLLPDPAGFLGATLYRVQLSSFLRRLVVEGSRFDHPPILFDFATLKRKSGWSTRSPAPPQRSPPHGFDLSLTGFDEAELAGLLDKNPGRTDPDDVPDPLAHPVTQPGEMWLLGTVATDVEHVLGGVRPHLMVRPIGYRARADRTTRVDTLARCTSRLSKKGARRPMQVADKIIMRPVEALIPYARNARRPRSQMPRPGGPCNGARTAPIRPPGTPPNRCEGVLSPPPPRHF